jgi:hypothetical protein
MIDFPFIISKRKAVKVAAFSLANALDRVLLKHPNKLITITYAKNVAKHLKSMDLVSAHKEAKTKSKAEKNVQYFVVLESDEFIIKRFDEVKDKDDVYSIWRNGAKVDSPKEVNVDAPITTPVEVKLKSNKMETKTKEKKPAAKKMAKKVAPKKAAKKAEVKKVKNGETKIPRGNNMFLTEAEWKKVDAILTKEDVSFSAWSRNLVLSKIKG